MCITVVGRYDIAGYSGHTRIGMGDRGGAGTIRIGVAFEARQFGAHVGSVLVTQVAVFFEGAIDDVV